MVSANIEKIEEHAKSIASREGCVFYDLEVAGAGKGRVLRVFIDKDSKDGVSIADCSNVSRALDLILDVEDLMEGGAFQLEVSSPGLERRLRRPWHFEKALGKTVKIQMIDPIQAPLADEQKTTSQKRKKVTGVLGAFQDGCLEVRSEELKDEFLKIPLENIKKANVVFDFSQGYNPKR